MAVITGGGGILCGVMAKAMAECGAKVAILDLKPEAAERVAEEIVRDGAVARGFACDVLDKSSIEAAHEKIKAAFGSVDILVNGAGGNHPKGTTSMEYIAPDDLEKKSEGVTTFYDLTADGIQFVFNLNFLGTFLPTQVFSRDMVLRGHGSIVNISSMNSFKPLTKIPAYSAAKAAVSNFTQWLAVHFSKVGVRVNAIAPGFFLTDQNRGLLTQADGSWTPRGNTILAHTPQGRMGKPEDLAGTLLWLLSDDASGFVTGQVIAIDGGFSAFSGCEQKMGNLNRRSGVRTEDREFEQKETKITKNFVSFVTFCKSKRDYEMHPDFQRADQWSRKAIGAAIEVHRHKGPGLVESIYEKCMMRELELQDIPARNQLLVTIEYKGFTFEEPLRLDVHVDDCLILELKAVEKVLPIHKAQLFSYMKLLDAPVGLLINFHEMKLVDGIHRMILPGANKEFLTKANKEKKINPLFPSLPSVKKYFL